MGEIADLEKDKGSEMLVLKFDKAFHTQSSDWPSRQEIYNSFKPVEGATANKGPEGPGMSGADMLISADKKFIAKRIKKIEVKYLEKVVATLVKKNKPRTLLVPVYYLFRRCKKTNQNHTVRKDKKDNLDQEDKEPTQLSFGMWRDCQAW